MSDFSLTLVLQIKTSKIINDMAKVQQKSEKISAFGGIFFVLDKFDRILSSVIDSHLGLRSTLIGYQYSEIIRAIFSVFCCGGDCMEDLNLYLKDVLSERPHTRVPSADTVLRGIEELATENTSYTAEKTGNVYDFNTAEKLNQLLIKLLLATGISQTEREVRYYAKRLNVSPKYLSETVRRMTGHSVTSYIDRHSIPILKDYLNDERLSLTQIADLMNFTSLSYFSRYCTKHLGQSPSEYRQSLQPK